MGFGALGFRHFLWLLTIAIKSTDLLSPEHTVSILYSLFHWLLGITPDQFFRLSTSFFGKLVTWFYGTLSVLAFCPCPGRHTLRYSLVVHLGTQCHLAEAAVAPPGERYQTFIFPFQHDSRGLSLIPALHAQRGF